MKYGCIIATVSGACARGMAAISAHAAVVVDEDGVAKAGLTEAVARIEHVGPAAMPVHVWIRDHHRIPSVVGTFNPREIIEPGPVHAVFRLSVADPVALR